jgi:hypothetical protein
VSVFVQIVRDQAALVPTDGQFEAGRPFGIGGRIATGVPAAVDLDGEVDVLAGLEGVSGEEGVVGDQGQGDTARGGPAHVRHFGAGFAQRPGRRHKFGVTVDAVWTGQQV